MFLIDQTA